MKPTTTQQHDLLFAIEPIQVAIKYIYHYNEVICNTFVVDHASPAILTPIEEPVPQWVTLYIYNQQPKNLVGNEDKVCCAPRL